MFKQLFASLLVLCLLSFSVLAKNSDDPFAKKDTLNIGKDVAWDIDKKAVLATKSMGDGNGSFYHLLFDNKQLKLSVSSDTSGASPRKFNQLEIKNVKIDGNQVPIFKWCLNNQERHKRFLQQGLKVKNGVCTIDGNAGTFVMRLNKDTLKSLQTGSRLSIMLKPFRTQLELNYDISDFKDMVLVLNAKPAPVVVPVVATKKTAAPKPARKCWAGAPPQYNKIKSVEYDCDDATAKLDAETWVTKLVNKEKEKEKKLAAEKEKQRKLAEEKKQKELAAKLKQEELIQVEAAAIAASQARQAEISDEITVKMLKVCDKYWSKGEHRCYCQKYIEHAPKSIQASSTCE
ncbi:MAG: hypothetical protein GQ550_00300 [Gammaproteobacteria bacterium]|nr:hypothetical protein [Gammaproteobacteria bacterium]